MLNKKLKVKIPKKFKKQLIARFSVSNAKKNFRRFSYSTNYEIDVPCPLCETYASNYHYNYCGGCPFRKFKTLKGVGCCQWIKKILNMKNSDSIDFEKYLIHWNLENNKQARKLLKKLKTQAKKYIEWV